MVRQWQLGALAIGFWHLHEITGLAWESTLGLDAQDMLRARGMGKVRKTHSGLKPASEDEGCALKSSGPAGQEFDDPVQVPHAYGEPTGS